MKTFKILDIAVQLLLIVIGVIRFFLKGDPLPAYYTVGGWQLLSCLIHFTIGGFYPVSARRWYLFSLLAFFILGLISLAGLQIFYLYFLLIFSPLMALWYCYICYKEVKVYQQKEWIQLK